MRQIRCVEKQKPADAEPIPDEIPSPSRASDNEKKEQQKEAFMFAIAKYQRVLGIDDYSTDHGELERLGGRDRAMELCAEKMVKLAQITDPEKCLSRQEALEDVRKQFRSYEEPIQRVVLFACFRMTATLVNAAIVLQ